VSRALRVLTLNCWNVSEPLDTRLALMRAEIAHLAPDVVALQEIVVRRDGFDQAAAILGGLGYHRVFGASFRWNDAGEYVDRDAEGDGFGNAVAARWPIVDAVVESLPGVDGDVRRSVLATVVDTPAGRLPFVTTHLDWRFDAGCVRERQVVALAALLDDWRTRGVLPPIVCGDLNAEPDATEIRFLKGLASLDGRSTYLQDAWAVAGDGTAGFTWDNRNRFTALMHEPNRRIDYVLVGLPDPHGRGIVQSARVVLDVPRGDVFPSDHFGVLAEVRVG
jgi:endonuclease/exonuclease/phosphatase family metal-dependent hydrolase